MAEPQIEGASPLQVMRGPNDEIFIEVDSLVAMFQAMAVPMVDGPPKKFLQSLIRVFEPMTTYAELTRQTAAASHDGSRMRARRCACGAAVVDGRRIAGAAIVIDVEPAADGEYFPIALTGGVPTIAPYTAAMDGVPVMARLSEHHCGAA